MQPPTQQPNTGFGGQPFGGQAQPHVQPQYQQPQQVVVGGAPTIPMGQPAMMATVPATSATTALVLGIVSIFCGGACLASIGLMVAYSAKNVIDQYPGHPDAGTVKAALIVNWIVVALTILVIIIYLLFFVILVSSTGMADPQAGGY